MRGRLVAALGIAAALVAATGCGAPPPPAAPIDAYRAAARDDGGADALGRWLLAELFVPGGSAPQANVAAARLRGASRGAGPLPRLALAIDDDAHGRLRAAARGYVGAFGAARASDGPEAELVAWYAMRRLLELRPSVPDLWTFARPVLEPAVARPGHVGFRAHADVVELWGLEELAPARMAAATRGEPPPAEALGDAMARALGCATAARFAGPFGRGVARELGEPAAGEGPGAWPVVFPPTRDRVTPARVLAAERRGCKLVATQASGEGVHLVETFFELPSTTEIVVAVQAAHAVLVDDVLVLDRPPDAWGVWPRFGVRLRLGPGRHRLVARLPRPETSIRIVDGRGAPLGLTTSAEPDGGHVAAPPEILADPNPLAPFLRDVGVTAGVAPLAPPRARAALDGRDLALRVLAADLAHVDGQDDLATVLLEPLVADPSRATGPALAAAARYLEADPVFAPGDAHDLAKDFRQRAVEKDPALWLPRLWLALDAAQKEGPAALAELRALGAAFPEAPAVAVALASAYAQLGWKVEHEAAVRDAARRFPHDPQVLRALLRVMDAAGEDPTAIEARLRAADPRSAVDAERALLRGDWAGAASALERFAASDPDRGDVDARIEELRRRAGLERETLGALERAVLRDPDREEARLALADAQLAAGDPTALQAAIARAKGEGQPSDMLREALETSTGATLLEPFRRDGLAVVRAYEDSGEAAQALARSATGRGGAAHAARVLDYAAIWAHPDGTARMLEHEILHMQSPEAIAEHVEQKIPPGTVLRVRTIKPDGRVLEPEIVAEKETVTMPHLEIGDYVETETIYDLRADGRGGASWMSPRWFFREAKIDYHLSELVVVAPREKPLEIETRGDVPAPDVREDGALRIHTWRVERSRALPEEPASVPAEEYLPSVRVGWGVDRDVVVSRFIDAAGAPVPVDPRLRRIARTIATAGERPRPGESLDAVLARVPLDERARRIYRWVVDNVESGEATDPRRIVLGKQGSRPEAFAYLCRLAGVEARHALVRDKLKPEATTGLSRATELDRLALRVTTSPRGDRHRWLVIADRFVPYGYMPAELRGQPAILLVPGAPAVTTDAGGSEDAVTHAGTVKLRADGSATMDLRITYEGRLAIGLRGALETLPEARLQEAIEQKLLPPLVPGARVARLAIENRDAFDAPLTLVLELEISSFARVEGGRLVVAPPFAIGLGGLARLSRRETPLLLADSTARRFAVDLRLELPPGATLATELAPAGGEDDGRTFLVRDHAERGAVVLQREAVVPAGRVQPERYPRFAAFAHAVDQAFERDLVITLPGAP
jgi:predicted Zn-dependent protease